MFLIPVKFLKSSCIFFSSFHDFIKMFKFWNNSEIMLTYQRYVSYLMFSQKAVHLSWYHSLASLSSLIETLPLSRTKLPVLCEFISALLAC